MYTVLTGVHGAYRISERQYDTLAEAKTKALRWSQSNSTGHYWSEVKNSYGHTVVKYN